MGKERNAQKTQSLFVTRKNSKEGSANLKLTFINYWAYKTRQGGRVRETRERGCLNRKEERKKDQKGWGGN